MSPFHGNLPQCLLFGTDPGHGNLALACHHCNLFKGLNLTSRDPDGDALVTLFHPRNSQWTDHFRIESDRIIGLTDIGRTTVFLLEMNADQRVDLRWINRDVAGESPRILPRRQCSITGTLSMSPVNL